MIGSLFINIIIQAIITVCLLLKCCNNNSEKEKKTKEPSSKETISPKVVKDAESLTSEIIVPIGKTAM